MVEVDRTLDVHSSRSMEILNSGFVLVLLLVAFAFVSFRYGCAFARYGFSDPDICWLLSLGRQMHESGRLLTADSASFTIPLSAQEGDPQPYILYQWLFEVVAYGIYSVSGLIGLLTVGAFIGFLGVVLVPLRAALTIDSSKLWAYLSVILAAWAAPVRCLIRPELVTALFLATWLLLLQRLRFRVPLQKGSNGQPEKIAWFYVLFFAASAIAWCNLHSGFVAGLTAVTIYAVVCCADDLIRHSGKLSATTKTLCIACVSSICATLINPYGPGLWMYLPRLMFSKMDILELRSLQPYDLHSPMFQALIFLCCIAIVIMLATMARAVRKQLTDPGRAIISAITIALIAYLCCRCVRLGTICSIIMVIESAALISYLNNGRKNRVDKLVDSLYAGTMARVPLLPYGLGLTCVTLGLIVTLNNVSLQLPGETAFFRPPHEALRVFADRYRGGRIFNNAAIGDMMMWYQRPTRSIFIDTQFDKFGEKIVREYNKILFAQRGWQQALDQFQIEWVFVTRRDPIARRLREPDWQLIYNDDEGAIFHRACQDQRQPAEQDK